MNLKKFNYVLPIAEHRYFETAMEKCLVAHSTLSKMISKFEGEIESGVFDKHLKSIELKPKEAISKTK